MKDTECATNTDALIKAVEMADECDDILILYQKKEECGGSQGFIHVGETSNATLNWMVDRFNFYLHGMLHEEGE